MDWTMYVLILAATIVVVVFMAAGMRMAYRMGYALGQLEASTAHTKLLTQQLAAQLEKERRQ